MSKELEKDYLEVCFKRIKNLQVCVDYEKDIVKNVDEILPNSCNKVEQALQRLKAIDNANPSKALISLIYICKVLNEKRIDIKWIFKEDYNNIKQALTKAQEQEKENNEYKKALRISKEKDVNIWYLTVSTKVKNYKDYNSFLMNDKGKRQLTEEEFNLLKRYYENV